MIINHNIAALNTHRMLGNASGAQMKSMEKLASGLRINRAADDAAGLSISEKMRGQIRGMEQATRNAQDGISLIQTAEGALNEVSDILIRMKELAVQKENNTYNDNDIANIDSELEALITEIGNIKDKTKFNDKGLLDASAPTIDIQINHGSGDTMTLDMVDLATQMGSISLETVDANDATLTNIETAIEAISTS